MRITKLEQTCYSRQYNKIPKQNNTFKGFFDFKLVKGDDNNIDQMRRNYNKLLTGASILIIGLSTIILSRK